MTRFGNKNTDIENLPVKKILRMKIAESKEDGKRGKEELKRRERANIKFNEDEFRKFNDMMDEEEWPDGKSEFIKSRIFENAEGGDVREEIADLMEGMTKRTKIMMEECTKILAEIEEVFGQYEDTEDRLIIVSEYANQWKRYWTKIGRTERQYEKIIRSRISGLEK